MGDAVLRRFAVVLALVGVALHVTSLDENPSQGFVTEGFAVLLLALALGGAPVARASCSRRTWPPPNRPTPTNNAEPLAATHTL
ncbi:hypothetical protein [Haloferax volcanii]|uniref:Uncharacterized protein n=1 Tax=Haloferax volcanii (strain ATCC 29605 / DSM 3757 / JCM 8879 / NBRC 14742 / NCIMB 2012 / VKM B-1768 / DS2) TaxID=309800 RepID=L9URS7_HALVD|nr:hypothetical protein [Haloferax volcanii]ELY27605.1 hypothetical protein C498_13719 [Haloferax volcanii DS2]MDW7537252.1 hypothetical protein [Haloferax volcanii]